MKRLLISLLIIIVCLFVACKDIIPPTVKSITPANNSIGVALDSVVVVTFSEDMDTMETSSAFMFNCGELISVGTITWEKDNILTYDPSGLSAGRTCSIKITTEAKDKAGNPLESEFTSKFTTVK